MANKSSDNRYLKLQKDNELTAAATKHIGFGAIVFLMIFAYLMIVLINFAVKENVNYTIAEKGVLSHSNTYTGLIIRDESTIQSKASGTLRYFMPEGARVRNNNNVFGVITDPAMVKLLDEQIQNANENLAADDPIFEDSYNYLKNRIKNYVINHHDRSFNYTYDAKNQILNDITEIRNTVIFQQAGGQSNELKLLEEQLNNNIVYSVADKSGLVSYKIDGLEFINIKNFEPSHLSLQTKEQDNSAKTEIGNNEVVSKVVDNYLWYIAAEIDDECEKQNEDKIGGYIGIEFTDKNLELDVKILEMFDEGDKTYMVLEIDRMVNRFLTDRFVNFRVVYEDYKGIKIPETAVTSKTFAKIPNIYFTYVNGRYGVRRMVDNKDALGHKTLEISEVNIYKRSDEYVYVPISATLAVGDLLSYTDPDTLLTSEYTIYDTEELEGVYVVNKGFARFKFIETTYQEEDYRIVVDSLPYGLRVYDRIATEASLTEEYQIIN